MHLDVLDVCCAEQLSTKRFHALLWPLAGRVKRLQIGTKRLNPEPGEVLRHIKPVRADVPHRPQCPSSLSVDAPVPVSRVEQPILRVCPLYYQHLAKFAILAHPPHLLNHRVVAQIMADAISKRPLPREANQLLSFLYRDRQGLLAKNMLASQQRILCHLVVRGIWGADVYCVDRHILKQLAIVVYGSLYAKPSAKPFRRPELTAGNRSHIDEFHSPERLQMHAPHKSGPDYCCPKPSHSHLYLWSTVSLHPPRCGWLLSNDNLVQQLRGFSKPFFGRQQAVLMLD